METNGDLTDEWLGTEVRGCGTTMNTEAELSASTTVVGGGTKADAKETPLLSLLVDADINTIGGFCSEVKVPNGPRMAGGRSFASDPYAGEFGTERLNRLEAT